MHLKIWVYDNGAPPAEPVAVGLCRDGRTAGQLLTDDNGQVTCPACLAIMRQLLL